MTTKMHVLFYAKKSRTTARSTIPIYLRVTIQGKRMEVTTNQYVLPHQWSPSEGRLRGRSPEAEEINSYLDYLQHQIYEYQQDILRENKALTIHALREKWFGIGGDKTYLTRSHRYSQCRNGGIGR